jgi:hypothetical protein
MNFVSRFLDAALIERLNHLQLSARRVVEGTTSGLHKSPVKGASVEFRQHRAYAPGDELRHLDWRVLGRTDRPYVKEYDEETNLRCALLLDASGSMAYAGSSTPGGRARLGGRSGPAGLPDAGRRGRLAGRQVRVRGPAGRVARVPDARPDRERRAGDVHRAGRPLARPAGRDRQLSHLVDMLERTTPARPEPTGAGAGRGGRPAGPAGAGDRRLRLLRAGGRPAAGARPAPARPARGDRRAGAAPGRGSSSRSAAGAGSAGWRGSERRCASRRWPARCTWTTSAGTGPTWSRPAGPAGRSSTRSSPTARSSRA